MERKLGRKYARYIVFYQPVITTEITTQNKIHLISLIEARDYWPVYVIIEKLVTDNQNKYFKLEIK